MPRHTFNVQLVEAIALEIEDLRIEICSGVPEDYAAYKNRCGIIEGLERALGLSANIEKKLLGDDPR